MAVSPRFRDYVLEQLADVRGLRTSRLFSAVGLYGGGAIFGLIHDDTLYFKTGESNIAPYRARNMARFTPFPERTKGEFGYREVPADVLEDAEVVTGWANAAIVAASEAKARTPKKAGKPAARKKR